jgi:hypothetical protein
LERNILGLRQNFSIGNRCLITTCLADGGLLAAQKPFAEVQGLFTHA